MIGLTRRATTTTTTTTTATIAIHFNCLSGQLVRQQSTIINVCFHLCDPSTSNWCLLVLSTIRIADVVICEFDVRSYAMLCSQCCQSFVPNVEQMMLRSDRDRDRDRDRRLVNHVTTYISNVFNICFRVASISVFVHVFRFSDW
jgi:hypothetical protein